MDCDLIVITAGRNRRVGETRLDLATDNIKTLHDVVNSIKPHYTRGAILVISNPVDILTYKVDEWMGLPDGKVFGSGCLLDTSRFICIVADYVGLEPTLVNGYMIGEHGDAQVPVWSKVTVSGVPIAEYCIKNGITWNDEVKEKLVSATSSMGAEIIRSKGKTHYGIATCVCLIADAIINMRPRIMPVSSRLVKEYGVDEVALSVPSVVGPMGVQQRIKETWEQHEYTDFASSAKKLKKTLEMVRGVG